MRRYLLLDACVAINLAATGRFSSVCRTLEISFVMTKQAAAEVGQLREFVDGELMVTPVDLSQYVADGVLQVIDLAPAEYPLYLDLAASVDDGEAATIAAAAHRGLQLATDDRKARRLCVDRGLPEPMRTLPMLHAYADAAQLRAVEIRSMIRRIRDRASFLPPRADPDRKWWDDHIGGV